MTTISPNRRRRRLPTRVIAYGVVFLCLLGLVSLVRSPLAGALWFMGQPMLVARTNVANVFSGMFDQFAGAAALSRENTALRAALMEAQAKLLDHDLLVSQVEALQQHLGRTTATTTVIVAGVIARPPAVPYDTLILDTGTDTRLKKGDLVTAGDAMLLGVVDEVYPNTSRVILFSAAGESHDVLLLTHNGTVPLSVAGQGAGSFVGEVPAGAMVSVGDMAILPGIPEHMVARVSGVETPPGASFVNVYLQFPVNIFSLRFVDVHLQKSI